MSRKLKAGTHQLGSLIADFREGFLKQYSQEVIPDSLIKKAYNDGTMMLYDLTGMKNADIYQDKVEIPIIKKVYSNASAGSSYDGANNVLALPVDAVGIEWTDSDGFDEDWVGTVITITDTLPDSTTTFRERTSNVAKLTTAAAHGLLAGDVVAISGVGGTGYNGTFTVIAAPITTTFTYASVAGDEISTADTGGTVALATKDYLGTITRFIEELGGISYVGIEPTAGGVVPTIIAANLVVQGETSADNDADEIDLTRYDNFKRIDKIIKMTAVKNPDRSNEERIPVVGPPTLKSREFEGLRASHKKVYSNYKNSILWIREGQKLVRSKGYSVSSYGTCTLHLTLFPAAMVEESDYLDVPDTEKSSVDKIALVKVYSYMKKEDIVTSLPPDVMQYYQEITASKNAKEEEKKA